jgi:outer membrane protein
MRKPISSRTTLLIAFLATTCPLAQADDAPRNSLLLGLGHVDFNTRTNDMTGPAGTTPPGIRANVQNQSVLAFAYTRHLDGPWSVTVQGGIPPVIRLRGAGTAQALGEIGTGRAWFPTVMGDYTWKVNSTFALQASAGLHYTFFTDAVTNDVYNAAFHGTSSRAKLSSSFGPVVKLGIAWSLDRNWFLSFAYTKYWINSKGNVTTVTPGVGDIERKIKMRSSPDIVSFGLGYRF